MKKGRFTEEEKATIRRMYLAGADLRTMSFSIGRGEGTIRGYLKTLIFHGTLPAKQPAPRAMAAVEYEEDGKTIKRYPLGWAEGAFRQKVTAKPRATI